jgi:DNA-binding NtrC family response regulator
MHPRILLVEDDPGAAAALQKVLQAEGYDVDLAGRGDDGLNLATKRTYDLVLTDLRLPGLGGLDLAARLHPDKPKLPIIMMTAHGTTDTAIEATKLGVYEYLVKPFEAEELLDLVASAVAHSRRMSEPVEMGEARSARFAIVGNSRMMQNVYSASSRRSAFNALVATRPSRWTRGCWPRRIGIWKPLSGSGSFAKICTTG